MKRRQFMRKRFQKGSLKRVRKQWIAQWWEGGHRRKARWSVATVTKSEAQAKLAEILAPLNARPEATSFAERRMTFGEFVKETYLPFYRVAWKRSTAMTNEQRIRLYLIPEFGPRGLDTFSHGREELQRFLNERASDDFSYSIVAHLRWQLRQIFRMAKEEGHIERNPAELLFIPRDAKRPEHRTMKKEEVMRLFEVLDVRERLIAKLAIVAGMRTGEIFALKWGRLTSTHAHIMQRVYHGDIDTPKTHHSIRLAALADGLARSIEEWRSQSALCGEEDWVFPSETGQTPVGPYNVWRRLSGSRLAEAGLNWVTFQVMRRTHSSLLRELDVAPEVRAQQMGHTVDVNENVYTRTSLESRKQAVNLLEAALTSKGSGSVQ
jgi:integrase